jgi:hypothetical protein
MPEKQPLQTLTPLKLIFESNVSLESYSLSKYSMMAEVSITAKGGDLVLSRRTGIHPFCLSVWIRGTGRECGWGRGRKSTVGIQAQEPVFLLVVCGEGDECVCVCHIRSANVKFHERGRGKGSTLCLIQSFQLFHHDLHFLAIRGGGCD